MASDLYLVTDEHDFEVRAMAHGRNGITIEHSGGQSTVTEVDVIFGLDIPWDNRLALLSWLADLTRTRIDTAIIMRMGFTEEVEDEAGNDDVAYEIQRVVLASGGRHGWKAGQYYASAQTQGGATTFWPNKFFT